MTLTPLAVFTRALGEVVLAQLSPAVLVVLVTVEGFVIRAGVAVEAVHVNFWRNFFILIIMHCITDGELH